MCTTGSPVMCYHLDMVRNIQLSDYDIMVTTDAIDDSKPFINALIQKRNRMTDAQKRSAPKDIQFHWKYPFQVEKAYGVWISGQIKALDTYAMSLVKPALPRWVNQSREALNADAYTDEIPVMLALLEAEARRLASGNIPTQRAVILSYGEAVNAYNKAQWNAFSQKATGAAIPVNEPWVAATIGVWVANNEAYLNSLSNEYIRMVHTTILTGLAEGLTSSAIIRNLRKSAKNLSGPRARLIARDQIGKLNGLLTQNRSTANGLSEYVWLTALDERVRANHKKMESKICAWKRPNVFSRDGKKWLKRPAAMRGAIPGSQIQCRCTSRPYLGNILKDIDKTKGR